MRTSAVAFGLAGLAAAGVGLVIQGSSSAAPVHADVVAQSCSPGKHPGWASRERPSLRIKGKSVSAGRLQAGDVVETDGYGEGVFCLRVATLECNITENTTIRVLPPKPNVLLRLIESEGGVFCTAISTEREWRLDTRGETIMIGRLASLPRATRALAAGVASEVAAASRSGNAFSVLVGKKRTLVKVRRGATIVAPTGNTRRAVVLGRQQQVVVPTGREPRQPTKISLTTSEKRTFKELERSLPAATDIKGPEVTIRGPRDPSSVRTATFSLGATEAGVAFSCALDGTDFRLCSAPHRIEGLKPGRHTLAVRAVDATGNVRTSTYSWAVDSSRIAFMSDRDGNLEIYAMEPDGSGQVRLTMSSSPDEAPDWSPDRRRIAFHSERDGNAEIYVMNADGSGQTRAHESSGDGSQPDLVARRNETRLRELS